jgi:hypothetical protein
MIADSFLAYREVHATMLSNGDEKPIWMTETSWRTTSATCSEGTWAGKKPEGVSLEQQARDLTEAYHCMNEDPYLTVALWFPLLDERGIVSGLLRPDGSRKPAFNAMRNYVVSGDQLSEQCGVFTGPRIHVLTPANNVRYSGPLPIHALAEDSIGVYRIIFKIDGKVIRSFGGHSGSPPALSAVLEWQGAKHIRVGRHTLTFVSYDKQLNTAETSITIVHLPKGSSSPSHSHASGAGAGAGTGSPGGASRHGKSKSAHHSRKHRHHRRHH